MSKVTPSVFRDAAQASSQRIAAMGDTDLNELMNDLLHAQAHRCHSPREEVRVNTEDKAKDGGCDGWTALPKIKDSWLGQSDTCWQFKAGSAGTPARLKGEIGKSIPKETLAKGGRFVVVASGSKSGKRGENDRLEILRSEATALGLPIDKIDVIGSERLTTWCNQNPAVAARWSGRPQGMWTLSDWTNTEVHRVPWQASENVAAELASQRILLDFEEGSVSHLHIYGQPGVGKTRFALELCREATWSNSVIYIQQAADLRLLELIDSAATEHDIRMVIVADEVQQQQILPLRDSIGRANGRIRLITIGHSSSPDPQRVPALLVEPLDRQRASQVVLGWHPNLPNEHVDFIVRFSAGFVRLAKLAADAVAKNTAIDIRGLLSQHEIRSFLDGMLGNGDRRALYVVAVLDSVGWTGEEQAEGVAVSQHLGLDWNQVKADVENYHGRLGIAPRGGHYRYISPTPLGIHLAVEAWTIYPELLRTLPDALPTEQAKDAYYARLNAIASNPQARQFAREQLGFFFKLADFRDARTARRWSALSAADPDLAASNIVKALDSSSVAERLQIEGNARREIVWTLIRLAWRSQSFYDATRALALLGEAENESWGNNAVGEFIGRFQIFLGGTALPYLDRMPVLDDLVTENRPALTSLVIRALARAAEQHFTRNGSEPVSDQLPAAEWLPATGSEHFQCITASVERLLTLTKQAKPEQKEDLVAATKEFAIMLRDTPVRPLVIGLFEAVRAAYPDTREKLRRAIADIINRERKYWKELPPEELTELDDLHARFEDTSMGARLRQFVGQSHWETGEKIDLRPLAKELLQSPDSLKEEWAWLTSGEAEDGWRLGEALAQEDADQLLAGTAMSLPGAGYDLRVVCGYIGALKNKLGDEWYDEWVSTQTKAHPDSVNLLFEAAWRCGVTESVIQLIVKALRSSPVAPAIVGRLEFGRWGHELTSDLLNDVLLAMTDTGHRKTALVILDQRIKDNPEETEKWRALALQLVLTPDLIRSQHTISWHWKELALRYVEKSSAEIAEAIVREHCDRSNSNWSARYGDAATVLKACADHDPSGVWKAILPMLSSEEAYIHSISFPRDIVDKIFARIPQDELFRWIDEHPVERAVNIARFINIDLSSDATLAARILADHGDKREVSSTFFSSYVSGSWNGPASTHWENLAKALTTASNQTKYPKLRKWAVDATQSLTSMVEQERQHEEERDLRGYR
jgi:hypothetical protein